MEDLKYSTIVRIYKHKINKNVNNKIKKVEDKCVNKVYKFNSESNNEDKRNYLLFKIFQ